MALETTLILFIGIVSLMVLTLALRWSQRVRARSRLFDATVVTPPRPAAQGMLGRWLTLAGIRGGAARTAYVLSMLVSISLAVIAALLWFSLGLGRLLAEGLVIIPGPAGALLSMVVQVGPFVVFAGLAAMPWLYVLRARRNRVESIEQDLPVSLELLATLSEAGFGFDAALERLVEMSSADRAVVGEFRLFQRDVLAGMSRVEAFRRLDQRVGVPAMTVLTSALVQADQIGASTAGVLRTQAEDLRSLRRERALAKAEGLEVKLVFPLVVCFLPGLFVAAVGPPFYEFIKLIDGLIRTGG